MDSVMNTITVVLHRIQVIIFHEGMQKTSLPRILPQEVMCIQELLGGYLRVYLVLMVCSDTTSLTSTPSPHYHPSSSSFTKCDTSQIEDHIVTFLRKLPFLNPNDFLRLYVEAYDSVPGLAQNLDSTVTFAFVAYNSGEKRKEIFYRIWQRLSFPIP